MDKEIEKLVELFKQPVKNISKDGNSTIIEFEDGQMIPLFGGGMELNYEAPRCSICGNLGSHDKPLFTKDDKIYLCVDCSVLAIETFLKGGIEIQLNIGDAFPELNEQLKKFIEKMNEDKKV